MKKEGKRRKRFSLSRRDDDNLKKDIDIDDHRITIDELCVRYDTDRRTGLSQENAIEKLSIEGPNSLTPPKVTPRWIVFILHMFQGFSILLWIGAGLCFIAYYMENSTSGDKPHKDNLYLGSALIFVCIATGIFSFVQETKSNKIMESFKKMVPEYAHVVRGGLRRRILTSELVRGDLVDIKYGDRIPADLRLIETHGFKVDNSSLTGESEPQYRDALVSNASSALEATNIAFFSTSAVEGSASAFVILTGDKTVIGRIAGLTTQMKQKETPIAREIRYFMRWISCWAFILGIFFFIACSIMGYPLLHTCIFVIGVIVANVPEGLLAAVTVCLSLTAKRMAQKNCVVKHLQAVETLGSTSLVCSDKTGTLTQNRMTVMHLYFDQQIWAVNYELNPPTGLTEDCLNRATFRALLRCGTLCSRAEFNIYDKEADEKPILQRDVIGDASESAILKFCEIVLESSGGTVVQRHKYRKVIEIPFNSINKYQVSIHEFEGPSYILVMKGAPERILERCDFIYLNGQSQPLTLNIRTEIESGLEELGNNGERVMGFCELKLNESVFPKGFNFHNNPANFPMFRLTFLGLIALLDPPRPGVFEAVFHCQTAGIRVVMVTGDHPITARAIAKSVGIIDPDSETREEIARRRNVPVGLVDPSETHTVVVQGSTLRNMSDNEIQEVMIRNKEIVFARTSPTQKLTIVENFQKLGAIVAVTGDGVNDSPALKKADIGIAMGITGSDVSKQAADMILLDDNFATIITGVEEGRLIFDNLKKCIAYILASNPPEIMPFLMFIVIGIPLPVGAIALLCIDLGTDLWPAIALAYEKPESDIMERAPRDPHKDKLVTYKLLMVAYAQIGMIAVASGFFVYFTVMAENGFKPSKLFGLRKMWDSNSINDVEDSYGQEWTYGMRKNLEFTCHTAYFVSIVICQLADGIIRKTRYNSFFHRKFDNNFQNVGFIFEIVVACSVSYIPGMPHILKTFPLRWHWWLLSIPYAIIIFVYDELRKLMIRRYPLGWTKRETYF